MKGKLERLQVIYDRDHGAENRGWYVRMYPQGDRDYDEPIDGPKVDDDDFNFRLSQRAKSALRGEARRVARIWGYTVPRDVAIEIKG